MTKHEKGLITIFTVTMISTGIASIAVVIRGKSVVPHPGFPVPVNPAMVAIISIILWLSCTVWAISILIRSIKKVSIFPGFLMLGSTLVLVWIYPFYLVPVMYLFSIMIIALVYKKASAVALIILGGTGHSLLFHYLGAPEAALFTAELSIVACFLLFWLRLRFDEWNHQMVLFNQARWAASKFVNINVRMQDNIDKMSSLARIRERLRVARMIHDSVGYTLTGVLVQLHAAQEVFKSNPENLLPRLEQLEETVRLSLQEVRKEVSNLRDDTIMIMTGTSRWRRLCDAFSDSTGVRVTTDLTSDLEQVDPAISETVYRIIQESLTNAYRHGKADYINVSMSWEKPAGLILLRISDNGVGSESVLLGNGLMGMRERVTELEGSLVWQTKPGRGFDLGIEIPWAGVDSEYHKSIDR